tara:strand:- start:128 stop:292 length:165 start_codon:yes stop_codon:yes gene_type:complete
MPENTDSLTSGKLTHRQTIDKMTADAYRTGGAAAAKQMRDQATRAAIRADRKQK